MRTITKQELDISDEELLWDHSPEQYELILDENPDMQLQSMLTPHTIRSEDSDDLTLSSHDEVFVLNTPPSQPRSKLRRRNAMRKKKHATEPRITRQSLQHESATRSQPTSPSGIDLMQCQNLEARLHPRHPISHETVNLQRVQNLERAFETIHDGPRRSRRNQPRIDYLQLHTGKPRADAGGEEETR